VDFLIEKNQIAKQQMKEGINQQKEMYQRKLKDEAERLKREKEE
jgi:hypothetical protein